MRVIGRNGGIFVVFWGIVEVEGVVKESLELNKVDE